jgi:hypothetical protein
MTQAPVNPAASPETGWFGAATLPEIVVLRSQERWG